MQVTVRRTDPSAAAGLGRALGFSATAAQLLLHRGFGDPAQARAYLSPRLSELSRPDEMADRENAAERLAQAVRNRQKITVFGDYDVDGTTSAALLGGALEQLGAQVTILLANRFEGGYGLSDEALGRVLATDPAVLVTCDCGSSDHERVERARTRGVDVLVVDHHLVPAQPLPALAFLNPHRPDCGFAYKGLCSAGLALSLAAAVRAKLGATLDLRHWLDLVALGTIADIAPLDGDNRRLVRAGLGLLSSHAVRPGVRALRELARISPGASVGAVEVAFRMTPRLNAPGRLGDQALTLELLRARSLPEARALAARVEQHNERRKKIEAEVTESAVRQVTELYGERPERGVVAAAEGWHRGVIGISAARLVDHFQVPAVVIALEDGVGHGSCRAPKGFRLFDAVERCKHELLRFGGHQAASGLSLRADRLEALRAAFHDATPCEGANIAPTHGADVTIDGAEFGLLAPSELLALEPLGEANPEPVFFVPEARVLRSSIVGERHLKLGLQVGEQRLSAFGPQMADRLPDIGQIVSTVGPLRIDTWNGGDQLELRLLDFAPA